MNNEKKAEYLAKADQIRENYISKKQSIENSDQWNEQTKKTKLLELKLAHNNTLSKLKEDYRSDRVSRKAELEKKLFSLTYKGTENQTEKLMLWRDAIARATQAAAEAEADKTSNALERLMKTAGLADDAILLKAIAVVARESGKHDLVFSALGDKAPLYEELLELDNSLSNPTSKEMFDESSIFAPVEYLTALDMTHDVEPAEPEPRSTINRSSATNSVSRFR